MRGVGLIQEFFHVGRSDLVRAFHAVFSDERSKFGEGFLFFGQVPGIFVHLGIQDVDADFFDEFGALRIVQCDVQCILCELHIRIDLIVAQVVAVVIGRLVVQIDVFCFGTRGLMQDVQIFGDIGCGVPVGDDEVFAEQGIDIGIDVPQLFGKQITAQAGKFVFFLTAALVEYAAHVVFLIKFQIVFLHGKIGERQQQMFEIDDIVPDEEIVADFAPSFDHAFGFCGFLGIAVFTAIQLRSCDRSDDDIDVLFALDADGDVFGKGVSKRADVYVGEAFCQLI